MSKFTKIFLIILAIIICAVIDFGITTIYENKRNKAEEITNEKLYELSDFPKIDASLATQPFTNAIIKNFTQTEEFDEKIIEYTNTHPGYVKLINDEVDLIVVTEPSEEELDLAKEKGVELEVITSS